MCCDSVLEPFTKGSGLFQHGHTYLGHPLACAASLAVQQVIRRDDLLANVRKQGAHLSPAACRSGSATIRLLEDVRGRGLFQAVELVADRSTKETFDPKRKLHARVKQEAMARGLMVYPMGGTIDGVRGDHVLLAPPFIVQAPAMSIPSSSAWEMPSTRCNRRVVDWTAVAAATLWCEIVIKNRGEFSIQWENNT